MRGNTYYNNKGKFQAWVDAADMLKPDMCDTDNANMNVFIAFSNLYYDIYNNGGLNIQDGLYRKEVQRVTDFIKDFNLRKALNDKSYLEDMTDAVFEKLMDKDLSFENSGFYNEWKNRLISLNKRDGESWIYITCGTKANRDEEYNNRIRNHGFEEV